MMLDIVSSNRFRKDLKLAIRRHFHIKELNTYAPLYATFKKYEASELHPNGVWVYLGNCLRYKTEDRTSLVKTL